MSDSEGMTSRPKDSAPELNDQALALMKELRDQQGSTEQFTGAVIFCPVCCSNIDASAWGVLHYECNNCGTEFVLNLRPETVAEFSMIG